ncbi:MAG: GntR family transcriptional regulator [Deltaproteobacteria bacterium]|nr:GntR family transcriptional regulator [Deltaproteobacteria bacterium]
MKQINIRALHQDVAGKLREMIRKGVLVRGQRIIETEICEQIGVSRTPLREALRVLESEGLVELFPHRGVHIRQPSMNEIQEMFMVMSVLEGICARLTAQKLTPAGWRKIERLHQKLETHYAEGDRDKYVAANNVFHALIQELAGNRVLDDVVAKLRGKVALYRHQQIYEDQRFDESIREHRDILDALRRRDAYAAETLMKRHLERQCNALVNLYDRHDQGEKHNRFSP